MGTSVAAAQDGVLRGVVNDSVGSPLRDVDVGIVSLHRLVRTDSLGRFEFAKVDRGEYELSLRRLGYAPRTMKVTLANGISYSYSIVMSAQPTVLDPTQVSATELRLRLGIEDFYRRRLRGNGGSFVTREDIEARNAKRTSDVLRGVSGLRFVRTPGGQGIRFPNSTTTRRGDCVPIIWLDGQAAEGLEVDDIPVHDIEGIEIYHGPSTTPMQFSHARSGEACGVIVVWTRIPGKA